MTLLNLELCPALRNHYWSETSYGAVTGVRFVAKKIVKAKCTF